MPKVAGKRHTGIKPTHPECKIVSEGNDLFIVLDGIKIAKRGHPGTPHARTWISLEPGWVVRNTDGFEEMIIEYNGVRIQ
jgi:hypothetical protein